MGCTRQPSQNVGIRALYVYFPRMMVQQQDLEAADGCSGAWVCQPVLLSALPAVAHSLHAPPSMRAGKYTVGLGQQAMTFCGDREDVVSMAATAMLQLLEGSGVQATDIGR